MIVLARYIRERFNLLLFVPLSILLAASGEISLSGFVDPAGLLAESGCALVLLLWLRLLDDLCSRGEDSERAPERITIKADNAGILWRWFFVLTLTSFALVYRLHHGRGLLIAFSLAVFLGLVYLARRRLNRVIFDLSVLVKYPAIALAVSAGTAPSATVMLRLVLVYLILVVYEVFHDRTHLADRRYLVPGLVAWFSLSIGFAGLVMLNEGNSRFGSLEWCLPFACLGFFLLAATCGRVRESRIMPFFNGIIYVGLMI